jgi:hypothetical protein
MSPLQRSVLTALAVVLLGFTASAEARLIARDNAADPAYGTFGGGENGGIGFGPWVLNAAGGSTFAFTADSKSNGFTGGAGVNSNGAAWGLAASGGGAISATRPFSAANTPLAVGDTFRFKMDYGFVDAGGILAATLQNDSGEDLLSISFTGGGASMERTDAGGTAATGSLGFSSDGFFVEVTMTGAATYAARLINVSSGVTDTWTGSLIAAGGGTGIAQVEFSNSNAGSGSSNDFFFNALEIDNTTAPTAADDASNYGGSFATGANFGTGFGAWAITVDPSGITSDSFVGDSDTNGFSNPVGIDTGTNESWGLFSTTGDLAGAVRPFSSPLAVGDLLRFDFDFGFVEPTPSQIAIALQNGSGQILFAVSFTGGGSLDYIDNAGATAFATLGFSDAGFAAEFTLTSATTYEATLTNTKYGSSETVSGTLIPAAGGTSVEQINFFGNETAGGNGADPGWRFYFNSLSIEGSVLPVELSAFVLD